jgi:transcriptional regulator with XRE-family HTH domain
MAGISTSTLTAMVAGRRRSSAETIRKVAEALRVLPEVVSSWLEHDEKVREPYVPPAESAYMSDRQRKAVTELIRAFTAEVPASDVVSGLEGDDLGVDETRPGSSPAPSALGDYRDATVHQLPARNEGPEDWQLTVEQQDVLAADEGHSEGKRFREEHDELAEAPDPEPGDEPA